jgi:hypothetical protein
MTVDSVYITMLGRSIWALLNSYYAVVRETEFRPARIVVSRYGIRIYSVQFSLYL